MSEIISGHESGVKLQSYEASAAIIKVPELIPADEFALKLVSEAMSWVGTPFAHQGKLKQVGVDCVNFIDQCLSNVGVDTETIPDDYRPEEEGGLLERLLNERLLFVPTENRSPGDIIAFCDEALRQKDKVRHIAFISERTSVTTFIIEAGRRGCVRHRLNSWWNARTHSCWRLPR